MQGAQVQSLVGKVRCCMDRKIKSKDFSSDSVLKNLPASAGDMDSIPGLGRSHMLLSSKAMGHSY